LLPQKLYKVVKEQRASGRVGYRWVRGREKKCGLSEFFKGYLERRLE
jgi:hypothetical protein